MCIRRTTLFNTPTWLVDTFSSDNVKHHRPNIMYHLWDRIPNLKHWETIWHDVMCSAWQCSTTELIPCTTFEHWTLDITENMDKQMRTSSSSTLPQSFHKHRVCDLGVAWRLVLITGKLKPRQIVLISANSHLGSIISQLPSTHVDHHYSDPPR